MPRVIGMELLNKMEEHLWRQDHQQSHYSPSGSIARSLSSSAYITSNPSTPPHISLPDYIAYKWFRLPSENYGSRLFILQHFWGAYPICAYLLLITILSNRTQAYVSLSGIRLNNISHGSSESLRSSTTVKHGHTFPCSRKLQHTLWSHVPITSYDLITDWLALQKNSSGATVMK